jgi:hypothetical protein
MFITRRLCANVRHLRRDRRVPTVSIWAIVSSILIRSGEEWLSAICATTIYIDAVTFFEDIWSVKNLGHTTPLILDLTVSLSIHRVRRQIWW